MCWVKGSQTPGVTTENERLRSQCRDRHEPGTSVTPGAIIFKAEFSLTPCKALTLANSLLTPEVFQALSSHNKFMMLQIKLGLRGELTKADVSLIKWKDKLRK